MGEAAERAKAHASEAGHQAKATASQASERLRETARSAAAQAKQRAVETGEQLRSEGEAYLQQHKARAADEVSHVSAAIRSAAERLRDEDDTSIAGWAETLADQIDGVSDYVRDADLGEVMRDVQGFARRRPELVAGGLFVAGLVLARVLKASSESQRHEGRGMETGRSYGYSESDLEREAALDADAENAAGDRLPPGPVGTTRSFRAGGFPTASTSNPTGATPTPPPGAAPASPYNPGSASAPDSEDDI